MVKVNISEILTALKTNASENLESDILEFKLFESSSSLHNSKDLAEEVSALANFKGGTIIIGVKDSKNVANAQWGDQLVGFPKTDVHITSERIKGKLKPNTLCLNIYQYDFEGKNFLVIEVEKKKDSIVATTGGKVCTRDGKSSRAMSPDEIQRAVKCLQDYDWSGESLDIEVNENINLQALEEAKAYFVEKQALPTIEGSVFLEAIGATQNGQLTKSGLLFLGKAEAIKRHLGCFEYRFSRKTNSGKLIINEVWEDCIWVTIKKAKQYFDRCNDTRFVDYENKRYEVQLLDTIVFHEAYLNALVHRDYAIDGMVAVNFSGKKMCISSPGKFYGGITADNIIKHEPRHRNKSLARLLMQYQLVDRAGMGITRMSINSLKYGRSFPKFIERSDSIEVIIEGEYFRPGIFVITADESEDYGIPDLLILNSIYNVGYVTVAQIKKILNKIVDNPWNAIEESLIKLNQYIEICGTRAGIFIRVKPDVNSMFQVNKTLRLTTASEKYIKLYRYLVQHTSARNVDIGEHLQFKYPSQTGDFLKATKFVRRTGKGPSTIWSLNE